MNKGFVKRSTFQTVSLNDATVQSVTIEGDEAYVSVMNSNGNGVMVRRQYERDLKKAIDASTLAGGSPFLSEWNFVDYTFGRVPLDAPASSTSQLTPPVLTTTAGDSTRPERAKVHQTGFKERIDLKANNTTYPLNVLIETVHYVAADSISA